jgi:hypothetical protein
VYNIQNTIKPEEYFSTIRWHILVMNLSISIKTVDVTAYNEKKTDYLNLETEEELGVKHI